MCVVLIDIQTNDCATTVTNCKGKVKVDLWQTAEILLQKILQRLTAAEWREDLTGAIMMLFRAAMLVVKRRSMWNSKGEKQAPLEEESEVAGQQWNELIGKLI